MRTKFLLTVMFVIAVFSTSCTKLDFMLRWADTYVMSYVTDYFELSSQEKTQAKEEFNVTLERIQKEDFPIYAYHLEQLANQVDKNQLNEKNIEKFLDNAESVLKKSVQKFEPFMQKLMTLQSKSNFDQFDEEFAEKQKKDFSKFEDSRKISKEQKKRFMRWVQETVEFLTDSQERELNDLLMNSPAPVRLQLESRQAVFEKFKAHRAAPLERQKIVRDFFHNWESLQTPVYIEARQIHRDKMKNFLIKLGTDLNQKQKQNLVKNLRKRALELKTLSER